MKNVGIRGKNKLANKFEHDVFIVKDQPNIDIPVYVVEREIGPKNRRVLHRNLLLPVNFLPLKPLPAPRRSATKDKTLNVSFSEAPDNLDILPAVSQVQSESSDDEDEQHDFFLNPTADIFVPAVDVVQEAEVDDPEEFVEDSVENVEERNVEFELVESDDVISGEEQEDEAEDTMSVAQVDEVTPPIPAPRRYPLRDRKPPDRFSSTNMRQDVETVVRLYNETFSNLLERVMK